MWIFKKIMFSLLFVVSLISNDNILLAQAKSPHLEFVGVKDGLSSRKVKRVFQDSYGKIWIKTEISLHRYNGYDVEQMDELLGIRINEQLKSKIILWEDREKMIWVKDENELVRYNQLTNQVDRFEFLSPDKQKRLSIIFVLIDHDGKLMVKVQGKRPLKFDGVEFKEMNIDHVSIFNELSNVYHVDLKLDINHGYIFKASKETTYLLNSNFEIVETYSTDQFDEKSQVREFSFSLFRDTLNRIYAQSFNEQIMKFDPSSQRFKKLDVTEKIHFNSLVRHIRDNGHFIIGGHSQLWDYNPISGELLPLGEELFTDKVYLIHDVLEDKAGSFWLSTNFGAIKFDPFSKKFETININSGYAQDFPNSARSITVIDDSILLISVKQVNYKYHLETGQLSLLPHLRNDMWKVTKAGEEYWAVRRGSTGIFKWDRSQEKFINYPSPYPSNLMLTIAYNNGVLWTGESKYLIRYDLRSNQWRKDAWNFGRVNDIYFESDNSIYLACDKGFAHIDTNINLLHFYNEKTNPPLSINYLQDIYVDTLNNFWLSTKGGGVNVLNIKENSVTYISKKDGLPNNTVYAVIPFGNKYWMPTDNGLAVYHLENGIIRNYTTHDGLSHNEFNYPSHCKYKDKIYLGTLDGVTIVDSSFVLDEAPELPVFINSISSYNKSKNRTNHYSLDFEGGSKIELKPSDSNLRIEFGLASYIHSDLNTFYYKIDGFEPHWTKLSAGNTLFIGAMPAGEFLLHIKAFNSDGIPNKIHAEIPIVVHKKFTQSWTFLILILLLVTAIYYLVYRVRMNQFKKLSEVRQRIAVNLHDEVGSMLTGIAMESDLLKAKIYSDSETDQKLNQIAAQSRDASSAMSDIVWSFDSRKDQTKNLVDRMRQHLDNLFRSTDIKFNLKVNVIDVNKKLHPEIRQNLYLVFKEATHNIIKHSNATIVNVKLEESARSIMLFIKDNGTSKKHGVISAGQGLNNMKLRAKRLDAKLEILDENGFTIKFTVPL